MSEMACLRKLSPVPLGDSAPDGLGGLLEPLVPAFRLSFTSGRRHKH